MILGASAVFVTCSEERESYTVKKEAIVEAVYSSITVTDMPTKSFAYLGYKTRR